VNNSEESPRILRGLVTLVKHARSFAHKSRSLDWAEVRRLRRLGDEYLAQVYGDGSNEAKLFRRLTESAFLTLHPPHGLVIKEPVEVTMYAGDPDIAAENQVGHLNKLDLNDALHALIRAAHRLREDVRVQRQPFPRGTAHASVKRANRRLAIQAGFPARVAWLNSQLRERGWGNSDPYKHGGPDRKTVEKILRGEPVRNDVLAKLAESLSKKKGSVNVLDIPQD
jgi:hypothetical protein